MKFLADEDFPRTIARSINKLGYSVFTVQGLGINKSSDEVVGKTAFKGKRTVLTFDKDFLEKKISDSTVVVFDFPEISNEEIINLLEKFLEDLSKLKAPKSKILRFSKNGLEVVTN